MFEYVNLLDKLNMPIHWIIHECQRNLYFQWYNNYELRSAFSNATSVIYTCHSVQYIYIDILQNNLIITDGLDLKMMKKYDQDLFDRSKYGILPNDIVICILGQIQEKDRYHLLN